MATVEQLREDRDNIQQERASVAQRIANLEQRRADFLKTRSTGEFKRTETARELRELYGARTRLGEDLKRANLRFKSADAYQQGYTQSPDALYNAARAQESALRSADQYRTQTASVTQQLAARPAAPIQTPEARPDISFSEDLTPEARRAFLRQSEKYGSSYQFTDRVIVGGKFYSTPTTQEAADRLTQQARNVALNTGITRYVSMRKADAEAIDASRSIPPTSPPPPELQLTESPPERGFFARVATGYENAAPIVRRLRGGIGSGTGAETLQAEGAANVLGAASKATFVYGGLPAAIYLKGTGRSITGGTLGTIWGVYGVRGFQEFQESEGDTAVKRDPRFNVVMNEALQGKNAFDVRPYLLKDTFAANFQERAAGTAYAGSPDALRIAQSERRTRNVQKVVSQLFIESTSEGMGRRGVAMAAERMPAAVTTRLPWMARFKMVAPSLSVAGAYEGAMTSLADNAISREPLSGRRAVIWAAGGSLIATGVGGGIAATLSSPVKAAVPAGRFVNVAANIADLGEKPGDLLQDYFEGVARQAGRRVPVPTFSGRYPTTLVSGQSQVSLTVEQPSAPRPAASSRPRALDLTPLRTTAAAQEPSIIPIPIRTQPTTPTSTTVGVPVTPRIGIPSQVTAPSQTTINPFAPSTVPSLVPSLVPTTVTTSTQVPVTVTVPFPGGAPLFPLLGGLRRGKRRRVARPRREFRYAPDLASLNLGLRAPKARTPRAGFTGFEARPIVSPRGRKRRARL